MFENNFNQNLLIQSEFQTRDVHTRRYNTAINYFKSAMFKGGLSRMKRRILGRQSCLYDLVSLKSQVAFQGSSYSGIKIVNVDDIIGTEGRAANFDIDFYPVNEQSRERWTNMAMAYLACIPLPPVELIQVGDVYFVRDGHHRISVARAFGQVAVDAEVITWKAYPPFPWDVNLRLEPINLTI